MLEGLFEGSGCRGVLPLWFVVDKRLILLHDKTIVLFIIVHPICPCLGDSSRSFLSITTVRSTRIVCDLRIAILDNHLTGPNQPQSLT